MFKAPGFLQNILDFFLCGHVKVNHQISATFPKTHIYIKNYFCFTCQTEILKQIWSDEL